mgnify:CR=1 FL=1
MKKYIKTNYTTFNNYHYSVVCKNQKDLTRKESYLVDFLKKFMTKDLNNCYNNPSLEKFTIYETLLDDIGEIIKYIANTSKIDINNLYIVDSGVITYNTFMFTFASLICDLESDFMCLIYCTPSQYQIIKIYPNYKRIML